MFQKCPRCEKPITDLTANFCSKCSYEFTSEEKMPYIGVVEARGIYRVTFSPQEGEFDSLDHVSDAIGNSHWNGDSDFEGSTSYELVRSTVTPETHPYECLVCKVHDDRHDIVSETNEGKCSECSNVEWGLRES